MEVNTLRIIITVVSFITFISILGWVWKRRKTNDFKEAANLPFLEE